MGQIREFLNGNKSLKKAYRLYYRIFATLYWNLRFILNKLFRWQERYACCFVFTSVFGRIKKNNWGDDLNDYLFSQLIKEKIKCVPFDQLLFGPKIERYSLIGSIIGDFNLNNTIIYGSGAITSNPDIIGFPKEVLSVRGPLTREVLLKKQIECPAIYGDPALLCPIVYTPPISKMTRKRIGVIPHYRTKESNWIVSLKREYEVVVIDMSKYEKWTDIIDLIVNCKVVLSESLHGLIISEAYHIPSVWVEFAPHNNPWEWEFKFNDFYESIGKSGMQCYKVYEKFTPEEILNKAEEWEPGKIDYDSMLKSFPFEIKDIYKNE